MWFLGDRYESVRWWWVNIWKNKRQWNPIKSRFVLLRRMREWVFSRCLFHKEGGKSLNKPHVDIGFRPLRGFCLLWASFNSELATNRVPTRFLRAPLMLPHTLRFLFVTSQKVTKTSLHVPSRIHLSIYLFVLLHYSSLLQVIDCTQILFVQDCWSLILLWFHWGNMERLHKVYDPAEAYLAGWCPINSTGDAQLVLAVCQCYVGSVSAQFW